ncbi:MAG: hypothetical protein ACRCYQ_03725 [Nocardioides sp.]
MDRIRWVRWLRAHHRPAAARFDSALLTLETQLTRSNPHHSGRDFVNECKAILGLDYDQTTRRQHGSGREP